MNNKTSVYDKENFFELYQKLRSNPISLNEIVEKPTMLFLLPDLQGKKLLDLGCGTGGHLQLYLERGADKVIGTDLSEKCSNKLKKICKSAVSFQVVFRYISYRWKNCQNCQNVILMSLLALLLFIILKIFQLY